MRRSLHCTTPATCKVAGNRANVVVQGGLAESGLYVLDVSSPEHAVELESYKTLWGPRTVAADESRMYVRTGSANGSQVRVLDARDPSSPVQLGAFWPGPAQNQAADATFATAFGSRAIDLAADDGWVYLATGALLTVDVTDPFHPQPGAEFRLPLRSLPTGLPGHTPIAASNLVLRVVVANNRAYSHDGHFGVGYLSVIDVSNPWSPALLGEHPPPSGADSFGIERQQLAGLAVAGWTVYVTAASPFASLIGRQPTDPPAGLHILNAADPQDIREIGFYGTPAELPVDVAVADDHAYVLAWERDRLGRVTRGVLHVLDVMSPTAPVEVAMVALPASGIDRVLVVDDRAYLFGGSIIRVLDLADPRHPEELDSTQVAGSISGLAVVGRTLYAAAESGGLAILRLE
jgi:hypothetical protein